MVAAIGTLLQLGVLLYSGLATYYPKLMFLKDGAPVANYAFPCTAAGTLLLVGGLLICSHVVESSTEEDRYIVKPGFQARTLWLQKAATVNDQFFDSAAIFSSRKPNPDSPVLITISRRLPPEKLRQKHMKIKSVIGTIVSLCGFFVQFIGLRVMHWSASIAQLGATLVMTILRSIVRRKLAIHPEGLRLLAGFELEWLSATLGDIKRAPWWDPVPMRDRCWTDCGYDWRGMPARDIEICEPYNKDFMEEEKAANAYRVMKIRKELGSLAKWSGAVSVEAAAVAAAVEIVMNTLFHPSGNLSKFTWSLATRDRRLVHFCINKINGKWLSVKEEIEAALSLWIFSVHREEHARKMTSLSRSIPGNLTQQTKGSYGKRNKRILGPYTRALHRDLIWWMPNGAVEALSVAPVKEIHRFVGSGIYPGSMASSENPSGPSLSRVLLSPLPNEALSQEAEEIEAMKSLLMAETDIPLNLLLAQDMFSSFMLAVAKARHDSIGGNVVIQPAETHGSGGAPAWQSFTITHAHISRMAQSIQSAGLGNLEEVFLSIVPPLSVGGKLPKIDDIVEWVRQTSKRHQQLGHWEEVGEAYLWLFHTSMTFRRDDTIIVKATAVLMEYLRAVTQSLEMRNRQRYDKTDIEQLEKLEAKLQTALVKAEPRLLSILIRLYKAQRRDWKSRIGQEIGLQPEEGLDGLDTIGFTDMHKSAKSGERVQIHRLRANGENVNEKDIYGWTPLHYASAWGMQVVNELLQDKVRSDVNARDIIEWTPLHYASERNNASVIRTILRRGAKVNVRGIDGITPLHCAAKSGAQEAIRLLVEAGAEINVLDESGHTPLHLAAYSGNGIVVDYLWEDTNKKLRDLNGRTPLHLAAAAGNVEALNTLVRKIATKNSDMNARDRNGRTPLHLAAMAGHNAIAELLLATDVVDGNSRDSDGRTPLHLASAEGHHGMATILLYIESVDRNPRDSSKYTPLHLAAVEGRHAIVTLFLDTEGVEKNPRDSFKQTPLHLAAAEGHEEIVVLLLDTESVAQSPRDYYRRTPLDLAIAKRHEQIISLFRRTKDLDRNSRNPNRGMPLHSAVAAGDKELVTFLLATEGVDQNLRDANKWTPLHVAAAVGKYAIAEILLATEGVDRNPRDSNRWTPVHVAAAAGQDAIVELLLATNGVDRNPRDSDKRTPLHLAVAEGNQGMVTLLLDKEDVYRNLRDYFERTPLDLAQELGQVAIAELLRARGVVD
jgi:ankyrin repeat protein